MPRLILPTTLVQASYLHGETEAAMEEGLPTDWLEEAAISLPRRARHRGRGEPPGCSPYGFAACR